MKNKLLDLINKTRKTVTKYDIIIFLLTFIAFLVTLFVYYPGILSYDSYNQLEQIKTGVFYNWHPFFHTFIELLCMKIWNSPASVALFQIITFSMIWTTICKYNRKDKKAFKYQLLITTVLVINPLNNTYAITLWKDILFCYALLLATFLLQIMVDKNYKVNTKFVIILSIVLAFTSQIRHNGMYIVIIMLIVLPIILLKKDKASKNYVKLPVITIIIMLMFSSLNIVYNVIDNEKSATDSKVMQLMAFYLKEDRVSDGDKEIISRFVNPEILADTYNPYFSDPIHVLIENTDMHKYKTEIYKMLIKYSIKNPDVLFRYAFDSTSIVWRIDRPEDCIGTIVHTDINSVNNVDNIMHTNVNKSYYQKANQVIQSTLNNKIISTILYSPALYLYLTIIIIGVLIFVYKETKKMLLILLPNVLNLIIVALSIPVNDIRYVYANFLIFYLVTIILINKMTQQKRKKDDLKKEVIQNGK